MLFDVQGFIVPVVEDVKVNDECDDEEETHDQEISSNKRTYATRQNKRNISINVTQTWTYEQNQHNYIPAILLERTATNQQTHLPSGTFGSPTVTEGSSPSI